MTCPHDLRAVAGVLDAHLPANTDAASVEVVRIDATWRVTVRTSTPGRVIGRRGATADSVRGALAEGLGDPNLQFNVEQYQPPPSPPSQTAGDREPRRPPPPSFSGSVAVEEPARP